MKGNHLEGRFQEERELGMVAGLLLSITTIIVRNINQDMIYLCDDSEGRKNVNVLA